MASSTSAYATGTDLIKYYGVREIGDLISDTDARVVAGSVPTNDIVVTMLKRASGEVEMAAQVGGKYTPSALASLTGVAATALSGLVCDLAYWHLQKRRFRGIKIEAVPGAKEAYEVLKNLRDGVLVFPTPAVLDSVAEEVVGQQSTSSVCNSGRYGTTVSKARRFFGHRMRDDC